MTEHRTDRTDERYPPIELRFENDHEYSRATWGHGAWDDEPDKIQWVDAMTDLDCLMHRAGHLGTWCGYVGVPQSHPAYGTSYNDLQFGVHGGLTYSAACDESPIGGRGICHIPYAGRTEHVWWLGFDCAHYLDLAPAFDARMREANLPSALQRTYRDRHYVAKECRRLAAQLAAMARAL